MPEAFGREEPSFFDAVTLSNFAHADRLDLLLTRYRGRFLTTTQVVDEVAQGVVAGYTALEKVLAHVEDGNLQVLALEAPAQRLLRALLSRLGMGEASLIAIAASRGGVVVTDDRAARESCREHGLQATGTIGILRACAYDGQLSSAAADAVLERMIEAGFYSPVRSISSTL
jgi:predicted nucleic acid-binding protein